jgi:natural product biosynthesis luciferase-like monooxygenase protein
MDFSILYFSSDESESSIDKYRLVLEGAKFADRNGFCAVWVPERHFHEFGGLFPNPAVLASALAMITERVRLRAGSVVLPLNNPIRLAEEWAVVDNLSGGRVDLSIATGWNANDFVIEPNNYARRTSITFDAIERIQQFWRGEPILLPNGDGTPFEARLFPRPCQKTLPIWITCTGAPERFIQAGKIGANILTALIFQSIDELRDKIALYRQALAENGHDPQLGQVTLMLHTFIGESMSAVRETVRVPFTQYLESSVALWRHSSKDLDELTEDERVDLLAFAFERYFRTSLFGTVDTCLELAIRLHEIGVNEIACLVDFGIDSESVMASLGRVVELKNRMAAQLQMAGVQ